MGDRFALKTTRTKTGQFSRQPAHDAASHGADALRYCAVAMQGARQVRYEAPQAQAAVFEAVQLGGSL